MERSAPGFVRLFCRRSLRLATIPVNTDDSYEQGSVLGDAASPIM